MSKVANIVAFRHLPTRLQGAPPAVVSAYQKAVRDKLVASGRFYLVTTQLDEATVLRTTLMNPQTSDTDLEALLAALRDTGDSITFDALQASAD